jgi:mannosyltransferase
VGISARPRTHTAGIASSEPTTHGVQVVGLRGPKPVEIVIALTALAAALRFGTLNVQSIWLDEAATMVLVHHGFGGMLSHLSSSESAPPLYYMLVWGWTKIFGAGPLGFRSFSALVGTLTIPVLYAAGRRISPRVGLWAAALATVNPAMYYYSQEARCYALLILFSAIAFVLWQHALQAPDTRRLALWAGASILALLTHYFAAFLFVPEALILARRIGWRRVWAPAGAVLCVGIALAPLALSQRANGNTNWIEDTSLASRIGETAKQFVVGLYGPLEILSGLIVGLLAAGALWLLRRHGNARERRLARDIALVAVTAIALPLLLAATHLVDVFDGRNVIAAWVPWAVLIAAGLGSAGAGRTGLLLGTGLCIISLAVITGINLLPAYQRDNWRGAVQALPTRIANRVIVGERYASIPLSIYLPDVHTFTGSRTSTGELVFIGLRTQRSGRSPLPPVVPIHPPPGFRLAGIRKTSSYAISRFVSPQAASVTVRALRDAIKEPTAEIILQRQDLP